ncbi:MAG: SDR family oxidoreductase [Clostridia bacterium]|nr:SDR family oxidoreductase [Clostridia bacterium]
MKNILITGATENTGLAIAKKFAENGWGVGITSREKEKSEEAARKIAEEFSVPARGYALELLNTEGIKAVFSAFEKDFGSLDAFVANAANLGVDFGLLNTDEANFSAIVDANVKGTFFCCQAAAEIMKRGAGGAIVTIGSVQANGAVRGRTVYSMTKAAISALVKNMAYELGEYGIRANNLVAGAIHSARWDVLSEEVKAQRRSRYPVGRESTEEEIANGVFFLGTDLSSSTTGTDLVIDSGISICMLPYSKSNQ